MKPKVLALSLYVLLFGCSGAPTERGVIVRDSAGIVVIDNLAAGASARWAIPPTPTVTIGVRDGPDEHVLFRVAAAFRLMDGRIVVANGGTAEFRFFDAAGQYLSQAAGQGEGPGELRVLFEISLLAGDTLVAFDPAAGRVDWFDATGSFVRRTNVNLRELFTAPYFTEGAHFLSDRTMLLRVYESRQGQSDGVHRANVRFLRYHPEAGSLDTLARIGGVENFLIRVGDRPVPDVRPFAREAKEAWGSSVVYLADTDRYEVRGFDLNTGSQWVIRRTHDAPVVTNDDREAFRQRYREYMGRSRRPEGDLARWLAAVPFPETKPPIAGLKADRNGRVWVGETQANDEMPMQWSVFGSDGRFLAQVSLPVGFTPLDIGDDYVLGRVTDDDGVEFVQLYELLK